MIVALSVGRDSPPELRERLALTPEAVAAVLAAPRPGIAELVVLSTCHRVELYARAAGGESDAGHALAALLPRLRSADRLEVRFIEGMDAVRHLFRVACGLDSLVVGEREVLGQVRRAYARAKEAGAAGPALATVFSRAIRLGRRVRAQMPLDARTPSIGAVVCRHIAERLEGIDGRRGVIVGAGEAAGDAAARLYEGGARLTVLSRRLTSAARLAHRVSATAHSLDAMPEVVAAADFLVVALSGGVSVRSEHLPPRDRRLLAVDLSVPRAIAMQARDDVEIRTLADLEAAAGAPQWLASCERMVDEEVAALEGWLAGRSAGRAAGELRGRAERIARIEASRAVARLRLHDEEAEVVLAMALRIANKLVHGPTIAMREGDGRARALIEQMFGLRAAPEPASEERR